jgi:PHO85 cyclin-6/7
MLALAPPIVHTTSDGPHSRPAPTYDPRALSRHQPRRHPSSSFPSTSTASSSLSSTATITTPSRSVSASHYQQQRPAAAPQQQSQPHHQQQQQPTPSSSRSQPQPSPLSQIPPTASHPAPKPQKPRIDIQAYNSQDLLKQLAVVLTQIATSNDKLSNSQGPDLLPPFQQPVTTSPIWKSLTTASQEALSTTSSCLTFHARNVPTISLESYLLRILKYCPTTNEVFLSLLVYFERMSKLSKEATGRSFVIDSFNIHRLVIAGVTVASKFFSDVFYTNSRYAKVRVSFVAADRRRSSRSRSVAYPKQSSTRSSCSSCFSTTSRS